jgi:hypothetical protein
MRVFIYTQRDFYSEEVENSTELKQTLLVADKQREEVYKARQELVGLGVDTDNDLNDKVSTSQREREREREREKLKMSRVNRHFVARYQGWRAQTPAVPLPLLLSLPSQNL